MIGRVVSVKSKNTATVLVERMEEHPLYKKAFRRSKKYLVEDTVGVKEGDIVDIFKTRPISQRKHWRVVKVVGRNLVELAQEQQKKKAEEIIAGALPEKKKEEDGTTQNDVKSGR